MVRGGQRGNRNAAKNKDWESALRRAVKTYADPEQKIERGQALSKIAEQCVKQALAGDKDARAEIANRLDGKAVEHVEVKQTTTLVHDSRARQIRDALRSKPPERTVQ